MAISTQKSDVRPISFVLHNQARGTPPAKVDLVIRPEDLTRTEPSRITTHQTLGGAWADNFGPGVPTVTISGTTGWGSGSRPDGMQQFILLHATVFREWHEQRADAVERGLDPDKVKLIFDDSLDAFTWVVTPQSFILKRNRSRPLLSQYQIALSYLSDDVAETLDALSELSILGGNKDSALTSLEASIRTIEAFSDEISGAIGTVLGPAQSEFAEFTKLTATVLSTTQRLIKSGMSVVDSAVVPLMNIAGNLSRAGANITRTYQSIVSIPDQINARFSRVAASFNNAACLFQNAFRKRKFLPNYDDLYGASTCSSTAGGKPVSAYTTENPFPSLLPLESQQIRSDTAATSALGRLAGMDPVLGAGTSTMSSDMRAVNSGVVLA